MIRTEGLRDQADLAAPLPPLADYLVKTLRHELVQPVHALTLMLDLAPVSGSPAEIAAWSDRIGRGVDGMRRMLGGLGELVRLELSPPSLQPAAIDLSMLFSQLRNIGMDPAGAHVTIGEASATAHTDRALLRLGLERLLENAVRHSRAAKVVLSAHLREDGLLVGVSDNGVGVAAEEIPIILDVLGTGAQARLKGSAGLGLGLPIARRIGDLLSARFYFATEPGKGTIAGFVLPL